MSKKTLSLDHVARVEGHSSIHVGIKQSKLETVEMCVDEPARFFEGMVKGRRFDEVSYIASRICGICSASHVITNLKAVERIFDIQVTDRTNALRELLIYGSYLQNHASHLFVFAAPDYLQEESIFPVAQSNPELFEQALGIKALGNELCNLVGGRSIHPITAVVGGFTHEISAAQYLALAEKLEASLPFAIETVALFNSFEVPDIQTSGDMLAMVADGRYPVCDSNLARFVRSGNTFDSADVHSFVEEYEKDYSAALFAREKHTQNSYFTGALARINASWYNLSQEAKIASATAGLRPPEYNLFRNNVAQAVELVDALSRCAQLCRKLAADEFAGSSEPVSFTVKAGRAIGFTEAPRGAVFHELELDENGSVVRACIIPPTAQNVANLESDMRVLANKLLESGAEEPEIIKEIEKLVRAYDPCFSCSVH